MERLKRWVLSRWIIGLLAGTSLTGIFVFGYQVYQSLQINALINEPTKIVVDVSISTDKSNNWKKINWYFNRSNLN